MEEAEHWGEAVLQPIPRRLFRFALLRDRSMRRWLAREVMRVPAPELAAELSRPMVHSLAAASQAEEAVVREDLARLPGLLDHADRLIAGGVIGGAAPTAADFQILSSVRVMLEVRSMPGPVEERACAAAARRLFPRWIGPIPRSAPIEELLLSSPTGRPA